MTNEGRGSSDGLSPDAGCSDASRGSDAPRGSDASRGEGDASRDEGDALLSSEAEALHDELLLRAGRRSRLALEQVWEAFRSRVRGYTASAEARDRLAALLEEIERAGHLALPRSARAWDASASPRLPSWVRLVAPSTELESEHGSTRIPDPREVAWPPELAFATGLRRPSAVRDLLAVRRFLAEGGRDRPSVPTRERSLELFSDEKRLDVLCRSSLFGSGRLTLELLRCHEVAPPLVWDPCPEPAAAGRSILVVENLHSHDSFRRWNARAAAHSAIAYGHGHEFRATCRLPRLSERLGTLEVDYFGDLDAEGLRVARHASGVIADMAPEITLRPATRWYRELLARADQAVDARGMKEPDAESLAWLPAELREEARTLFAAGRRLPQEVIGWEVLEGMGE